MKYINDTGTTTYQDGDVPIIKFNNLSRLDFVDHAFSTRLGGVSTGEYFSMNLTHTRNDIPACVDRNFEIIAQDNNEDERTHSVKLMPMIDNMFKSSNLG